MLGLCLSGFLGNYCTTRAYQCYDASKLAPFQYIFPAASYILDIIFLDNQPDTLSAIGSCVIVGLSLLLLRKGKKKEEESQPNRKVSRTNEY